MTGFQPHGLGMRDLEVMFRDTFNTKEKSLEFIMKTLRSAKTIYKDGGHVTPIYRDQLFSLKYDNRRVIIDNVDDNKTSEVGLLDSKPHSNVKTALTIRKISKVAFNNPYTPMTQTSRGIKYKDKTELAVRNFLKGLLAEPVLYRLVNDFENYSAIIDYIRKYNPKIKISQSNLSHLKNRNTVVKIVPRNNETILFVDYVKIRFPDFDDEAFFNAKGK